MKRIDPFGFVRELATRWDLVAIVLVVGLVAFLGEASRGLLGPLARLDAMPLSLDPIHLPEFAARRRGSRHRGPIVPFWPLYLYAFKRPGIVSVAFGCTARIS
jgi:hypothetical protein